jgi:hypothetical protein
VKRNVISFCLFGADPMYTVGALRNIELAPKIYPGWSLMFWIGAGVPEDTLHSLATAGVELRNGDQGNPMINRFLVNDLDDVDRYLIRDTDSRLNAREAEAVSEWTASGKHFMVIRDHPGHRVAMPGGLWGGTAGRFSMRELVDEWSGNKKAGDRQRIYNNDQLFLRDMVWPRVQPDCYELDFCTRDTFRAALPFPARFGDWRFCGERFGKDETPEPWKWEQRLNFMSPS